MVGGGGFVEEVVGRVARSRGSVEGSVLCGYDWICNNPVEGHGGGRGVGRHGAAPMLLRVGTRRAHDHTALAL